MPTTDWQHLDIYCHQVANYKNTTPKIVLLFGRKHLFCVKKTFLSSVYDEMVPRLNCGEYLILNIIISICIDLHYNFHIVMISPSEFWERDAMVYILWYPTNQKNLWKGCKAKCSIFCNIQPIKKIITINNSHWHCTNYEIWKTYNI